jgi:hypothetical protein
MSRYSKYFNNLSLVKGGTSLTLGITIVIAIFSYVIITYSSLPQPGTSITSFTMDYHPDEGVWVVAGKHYFQKFFLEKDHSKDTWEDQKFGDFGTRNPVLGKYLYGAWLFADGSVSRETAFTAYDFKNPDDWVNFWDLRPDDKYLISGRKLAKWMGVLCTLVLFLLIRELTNSWLLGMVTAVLFVLQPITFILSSRVMMDIPVLLFSLVALLAAAKGYREFRSRKLADLYWQLVLIGLLYGLAMQIKLNSLLVCFTLLGWLVIQILWEYKVRVFPFTRFFKDSIKLLTEQRVLKLLVIGSVLMVSAILVVFISLNPFLYHNTLENLYEMFNYGETVTDAWMPGESAINDTWSKKVKAFISVGLHYSSISRHWLGFSSLLDKLLVLFGFVFAAAALLFHRSDRYVTRGFLFLLLWSGLVAAGLLYWIPFKWARWYLPMAPIWALFETLGLLLIFMFVKASYQEIRVKITSQ